MDQDCYYEATAQQGQPFFVDSGKLKYLFVAEDDYIS